MQSDMPFRNGLLEKGTFLKSEKKIGRETERKKETKVSEG